MTVRVNGHRSLTVDVFINDKDEIIGYQLSKDFAKSMHIIQEMSDKPPTDTKYTLLIKDVYGSLTYSKVVATDEDVTLEEYEVTSVYDLKKKVDEALQEAKKKEKKKEFDPIYCTNYVPISAAYSLTVANCMTCAEIGTCAEYADMAENICNHGKA